MSSRLFLCTSKLSGSEIEDIAEEYTDALSLAEYNPDALEDIVSLPECIPDICDEESPETRDSPQLSEISVIDATEDEQTLRFSFSDSKKAFIASSYSPFLT
mmetsp:Transcript_7030/g.14541  ORF Transcript_7030/g.14541 Transcript_7030/m.14541 type:complete len:102 (-) Transcript_7030:404-709(-)